MGYPIQCVIQYFFRCCKTQSYMSVRPLPKPFFQPRNDRYPCLAEQEFLYLSRRPSRPGYIDKSYITPFRREAAKARYGIEPRGTEVPHLLQMSYKLFQPVTAFGERRRGGNLCDGIGAM